MNSIVDFIKTKILRTGQKPLLIEEETKPVNMTRILCNPQSILIVPYNRMGTILLATRVFKALRDHFGDVHIAVVVHDSWGVLIKRDPTIDEVITFGDYIDNPHSKEFKDFASGLGARKFDLAFFLSYQYDTTLAYLIRKSEAKLRISFNESDVLDYFNIGISPATGLRYEVDRYLEMLHTMGIFGETRDYMMTITESIREKARQRYLPSGPDTKTGRLLGFDLTKEIVGSPIVKKNAEFIIRTLVTGLNATVVVFYEPGKTGLAAELKDLFGKDILLVEDRPASMLAGMLSHCRFVVTFNTDLLQLAIALKMPTVGILTEKEARQWSPGENENLIHLLHSEGSLPSSGDILETIKKLLKQTKKS